MMNTPIPTPDIDATGFSMEDIVRAVGKLIASTAGRKSGWLEHEYEKPTRDHPGIDEYRQVKYEIMIDVTDATDFRRHALGRLSGDRLDMKFELTLIKAETFGPRLIATWHVEIG